MKLRSTILAAALLGAATPALAHHSFAMFDLDPAHVLTLNGTVKELEWVNPHSWIHVDVTTADGKTESWMCEAGSPNVLLRRGFNKNTFAPGTKVIVDGYQSKDGSHRANGRDLKLPNGQQLFLGSSGPDGAPYEVQRPGVDVAPAPKQ